MKTVNSLMICTPKDANYEIIVTDDGKNNETQLLISNTLMMLVDKRAQ